MHLGQAAVLVFEEAARAVGAAHLLVEGRAQFGLVLVLPTGADGRAGQSGGSLFVHAMCELTFLAVATGSDFDPVLAHLALVLGDVQAPGALHLVRGLALADLAAVANGGVKLLALPSSSGLLFQLINLPVLG